VSLSTPGTTLAVPWGMNVNPALETLGNLSLMGSEEGKMVEKRLWKVFTALCVALQWRKSICHGLLGFMCE